MSDRPELDSWEVWCCLCAFRCIRWAVEREDALLDGICPDCGDGSLIVGLLPEWLLEPRDG